MTDVRIREERGWSRQHRYMVEARREMTEGRIWWLPLASFATLVRAITWCRGGNYNILVDFGDDKCINVEHLEISN